MKTNGSLTLYSKSDGVNGPTYTRTHVRGVCWQEEKRAAVTDNGLTTADSALIFVPLTPGTPEFNKGDIVVRGITGFELSGVPGQTEKDIFRECHAVRLISVAKFDYGATERMNHFELEGR
jgi:hypothetical protein